MSLLERLERLRHGQPADISRFAAGLDSSWIEQALVATGKATMRKRKLPAAQAVWVVIGMALFSNRSIQRVVEHLELVVDGLIASSAVTRARRRLGVSPLRWLFERVSQAWGTLGEQRWRGLALYGLDGSHLRVDDSDENAAHFGRPRGRTDGGYPQLRMVALMNLTSRLLTGAAIGPWSHSEAALAKDLWACVPDQSLTIVDRGFLSFAILWQVLSGGSRRHFLIRLKKNSTYQVTQVLADGSALAHIKPHSALTNEYPDMPRELTVRLVAYQHPGGEPGILMTSLLDPAAYPAPELLLLYHERWELELAFDELKTHMLNRKEALRSRTSDGVYQEVWGILLVYNLLRREMAAVADAKDVPANRISFTGALLLVQNFFISALTASPGTIPRELADLEHQMGRSMLLPERRSKRRCPRQVKIKMSNYRKAPGRARKVA